MASSDYNFTLTRNQIISRALYMVGALPMGEVPSGFQLNHGVEILNTMVNAWQADNTFLWTQTAGTLTLSTTYAYNSLGLNPPLLAIDQAYLRISNDDSPLEIISWYDYQAISDKSSTGDPWKVALKPGNTPLLYVYPIPTTSRTLYYLGVCRAQDWDSASAGADFPVSFMEALIYGLAERLAPEYRLSLNERTLLAAQAADAFRKAKRGDSAHVTGNFVEGAF